MSKAPSRAIQGAAGVVLRGSYDLGATGTSIRRRWIQIRTPLFRSDGSSLVSGRERIRYEPGRSVTGPSGHGNTPVGYARYGEHKRTTHPVDSERNVPINSRNLTSNGSGYVRSGWLGFPVVHPRWPSPAVASVLSLLHRLRPPAVFLPKGWPGTSHLRLSTCQRPSRWTYPGRGESGRGGLPAPPRPGSIPGPGHLLQRRGYPCSGSWNSCRGTRDCVEFNCRLRARSKTKARPCFPFRSESRTSLPVWSTAVKSGALSPTCNILSLSPGPVRANSTNL